MEKNPEIQTLKQEINLLKRRLQEAEDAIRHLFDQLRAKGLVRIP
jgi:hypothetical protein